MYVSENSKGEIQFWNIYLKAYVSLSKQQNNVNCASSKLVSTWASLSMDKVLAIQVFGGDLLRNVLSTGCTPRKMSVGRMKTFRGP